MKTATENFDKELRKIQEKAAGEALTIEHPCFALHTVIATRSLAGSKKRKFIIVKKLFVYPKYRRKKVATSLIDTLEKAAFDFNKVDGIILENSYDASFSNFLFCQKGFSFSFGGGNRKHNVMFRLSKPNRDVVNKSLANKED